MFLDFKMKKEKSDKVLITKLQKIYLENSNYFFRDKFVVNNKLFVILLTTPLLFRSYKLQKNFYLANFGIIVKFLKKKLYFLNMSKKMYLEKLKRTNIELDSLKTFNMSNKVIQLSLIIILQTVYRSFFEKTNCSFKFYGKKGVQNILYL